MSKQLLIATAAALLATVSASYAQTTVVTGSYSATATETSGTTGFTPGLSTLGLGSPFSQTLTVGTQTAETTFVSVNPIGGASSVGTIQGIVSVSFNNLLGPSPSAVTSVTVSPTTPGGHAATLVGGNFTVAANYELFYGTSPQTDCISWNSTTCTDTGVTTVISDTLVVTFADNAVLNINLYNWSDWNMTPGISFKLVSGPHTTVPEPMSIAVLGSALTGLGVIRRRRSRVNNAGIH